MRRENRWWIDDHGSGLANCASPQVKETLQRSAVGVERSADAPYGWVSPGVTQRRIGPGQGRSARYVARWPVGGTPYPGRVADPNTYRPRPGEIPTDPGVYRFRDKDGRVIYVGKAKSLRPRLSSYFQDLAGLRCV